MMKNRTKLIGMLVVGVLALGQAGQIHAADANPPEWMTYQGYLVDGNGDPLGNSAPANYDVVFRIYKAKQGGTAIWAEQQTVTVDKGYFSVLLGEGAEYGSEVHNALSGAFDGTDASDRFIGITVSGLGGADVEIAPRLRLVTSPYAFTATQARNVSDGSGNKNFFKEGSDLKLGAGATPTLTLPEGGGATLAGKLTINYPDTDYALEIFNGNKKTRLGAINDSYFHIDTQFPRFYFWDSLTINGDIESASQDLVLGVRNNADVQLTLFKDSDKITAQADEFRVQGDSKYLKTVFTANATELRTDAASIYMDKPLEVEGALTAGALTASSATVSGNIGIGTTSPGAKLEVGHYGSEIGDFTALRLTNFATLLHASRLNRWEFILSDINRNTGLGTDKFSIASRNSTTANPIHRLVIDEAGNVGIGTDSPSSKLTVNGGGLYDSSGFSSKVCATLQVGRGGGNVGDDRGTGAILEFRHATDDRYVTVESVSEGLFSQHIGLAFKTVKGPAVPTERMRIGSNGNVGIGVISPAQPLHIESNTTKIQGNVIAMRINGSGTYWDIGMDDDSNNDDDDLFFLYKGVEKGYLDPTSGGWKTPSDRRLKRDIQSYSSEALEGVRQIPVYTYRMKTDTGDTPVQVGLMAQDVQKVFPELVEEEDSRLGLDYGRVAIMAFPAIVELKEEKDAEIETLREENASLKTAVQALADEVSALKANQAANQTTEARLAKLEDLVSKIGQGE